MISPKAAISFVLLLLGTTLAGAEPIPAPSYPPKSSVYVKSISYGGSGCPQGSLGYSISDDKTVFTLIFDSFIATLGGDASIVDSRKNCQISIDLNIPGGWSYSVSSFIYRGYAEIVPGQTGVQSATYYFSGETDQATASSSFHGPYTKDYTVKDDLGVVAWSRCGATEALNVNSAVRIDGPASAGQSLLTVDSVDGKFRTILNFNWRRC